MELQMRPINLACKRLKNIEFSGGVRMDVYDFQKDLLEEVKATAATSGEGSTVAFVSVVTNYLINADVLNDFSSSFYMGTGKNNRKIRVDGYVFDEFDFTMNLIIADYSGDITREVVTKSAALQHFDRLFYFIEEALGNKLYREIEISTPAADLVEPLCFILSSPCSR